MKSFGTVFLLIIWPLCLLAEDVYITDRLQAGLHEEKSTDSPIVKIVTTGTRLEVVKREDQLTFVKDASGVSGWISNIYLVTTSPGKIAAGPVDERTDNLELRLNEAREKIINLETQLKNEGRVLPADILELAELRSANEDLRQQFNAQKLKTGELQIELTELRNRLGQDSDSEALYGQLKKLEDDNKKLEIQLANTLDKYQAEGAEGFAGGAAAISGKLSPGLRNTFIYLGITLVLGIFAGAYLLDLVNRRRHGGFRI